MAEAFARHHGAGGVDAWSAGSRPSGVVNPKAIFAMRERGIDLSSHFSKGFSQLPDQKWDFVITMGCGDACPFIDALHREDWALPDPRDMSPPEFAKVRDQIERRVKALLNTLQKDSSLHE